MALHQRWIHAGLLPPPSSPSHLQVKRKKLMHFAWFEAESSDLTWFACGFHPKP